MPNVYCNLATLKDQGTLGITNTTADTQLLRIAEQASRYIDKETDRFYYIYEGTMYQDGAAVRAVLDFDVQSITELDCDTGADGTYATTFNLSSTPVDAYLYPQNITPKTRLEINPYGNIGHFAAGVRNGIKIIGVFGYGNDWPSAYKHTASVTLGADLASSASYATLSGNSTGEICPGMTLRITNSASSSEQMYVTGPLTGANNSTCPVTRSVNGTSAGTTASTATAISVYDYPAPIVQACIIQTIRTWKRRESGYVNTIINTDMGSVQVFKGLDPDVKAIVKDYKRERVQRYIW